MFLRIAQSRITTILLPIALVALFFSAASQAVAEPPDIVVERPWARASIGVNRPGAAYFEVRNYGDATIALVSVETDIAAMPQVHQTTTDANGVSRMGMVERLEIAPRETRALEPSGAHVMLMKLQRPMKEGERFALKLHFESGKAVTVEVPIRGLAARGPDG